MNILECNITDLRCGDLKAFEIIFRKLSGRLERFAYEYVLSREEASDIVQRVFVKLWECKESLTEDTLLFNFLITLTRNQCINHLNQIRVQRNYQFHKGITTNELLLNYYALNCFDNKQIDL